jgi:hypothetical protein
MGLRFVTKRQPKEMNRRIKLRLNVQKHEVELDAWEDWLHNLTNPEGEDEQRLAELRVDLLQLVAQSLSEARQQFILLHYFEEQPNGRLSGTYWPNSLIKDFSSCSNLSIAATISLKVAAPSCSTTILPSAIDNMMSPWRRSAPLMRQNNCD